MELSEATQREYYQKLKIFRLDHLAQAVDGLIDDWMQPHVIPPIATVREYVRQAQEHGPTITDSRRIIGRGDKPPDWEPLQPGELSAMRAEATRRARKIERDIAALADHKQMPVGLAGLAEAEWNRRRDEQLRRFRHSNPAAGEA